MVDDEPDVLLVMRMQLERAGHTTALAADGEQALERLDDAELVLLDVSMPIMDGWSVLEAVRARAEPMPVVVMSGRGRSEDIRRAFELGAADYLTKPFLPDRLLAVVDAVLSRRAAARDGD